MYLNCNYCEDSLDIGHKSKMYLNCDYCGDYLDKGHKSCDECGYAFGSDEMGYGNCKSNNNQFNYIMIFEGGNVYKSKELTDDEYDSWESGVVEFIRVSDMKVYDGNGIWRDIKIA